jgi:hypothetical protein
MENDDDDDEKCEPTLADGTKFYTCPPLNFSKLFTDYFLIITLHTTQPALLT